MFLLLVSTLSATSWFFPSFLSPLPFLFHSLLSILSSFFFISILSSFLRISFVFLFLLPFFPPAFVGPSACFFVHSVPCFFNPILPALSLPSLHFPYSLLFFFFQFFYSVLLFSFCSYVRSLISSPVPLTYLRLFVSFVHSFILFAIFLSHADELTKEVQLGGFYRFTLFHFLDNAAGSDISELSSTTPVFEVSLLRTYQRQIPACRRAPNNSSYDLCIPLYFNDVFLVCFSIQYLLYKIEFLVYLFLNRRTTQKRYASNS